LDIPKNYDSIPGRVRIIRTSCGASRLVCSGYWGLDSRR